jgi:tetratricopeptide (TPR) repeat protein
MNVYSSAVSRFGLTVLLLAAPGLLQGQTRGGGTRSTNSGTAIGSIAPSIPEISAQPIFISGKVLIDGGGPPSEPVAIERVCDGIARRQGYSDTRGSFQFRLDQSPQFQDASETNSSRTSLAGVNTNSRAALRLQYQNCEFRAIFPGFLSTTLPLRLQGNNWQYDLGTIFLRRTENAVGTTVSLTTLTAPKNARRAYEKGVTEYFANKLIDAEKHLNQAVKDDPNLAAAWSLLGDIHSRGKVFDQAVKEYQRAQAADPKYMNPTMGLALVATQQKRWQDAVQFTEQVFNLNPSAFPAAYFYNALANYNLGRLDAAEASARKFASQDKEHTHPEALLLLGQIYFQKNDPASAAEQLRNYLTLSPDASNAEAIQQWLKEYDQKNVAKK